MLKTSLPTPIADGVTVSSARLNLEIMAIYETMGCLTTGQEPILISDRWDDWWFCSSRSTYEEHSVEKQFGMSRKMVHLFARLTKLLSRVGSGGGAKKGLKVDDSEMGKGAMCDFDRGKELMDVGTEARTLNTDVESWIESLKITTLEHERVQVGNRAYAHAMKVSSLISIV